MDTTTTEPPAGIPPLIPDSAAMAAALGGPPIPMKVGRPLPPSPAPAPGPALAAAAPASSPISNLSLSGTFTGVPAIEPGVRSAIAEARILLNAVIAAIAAADAKLPALIDQIDRHAVAAQAVENFDVLEATKFYIATSAALQDLLTD